MNQHFTNHERQGAFTLIELLVVIAVIAILASLLVPLASRAKAYAQRAKCLSNLRQLGVATFMYVRENNQYPPAWEGSQCRWMNLLTNYLTIKADVYRCPSDTQQIPLPWDTDITMSYGMNCFNFAGNAWCFWYGVAETSVARPAGTILYADCTPGAYWCGGGGQFRQPVVGVDYRHVGQSFCAAYCDGHAEIKNQTEKSDWDASQ